MKLSIRSATVRALVMSAGALVAALAFGGCAPDTDGFSTGPGSAASPGESANPGGASGASLDAVRTQLTNRGFQFGTSSSNGSRDVFDTTQTLLGLCGSGLFVMQERSSFSGGGVTNEQTHTHGGRWAIVNVNGSAVLELTLLSSTQSDPSRVRRLAISGSGAGVRFNNQPADSEPLDPASCAELARRLGAGG